MNGVNWQGDDRWTAKVFVAVASGNRWHPLTCLMFLTTILFLGWDLGGPVQSLRQQPWREQRVSLFFVVKMMLGAQGTLCSRSDLECPTINLPFTTINPIPSHPLLSTTYHNNKSAIPIPRFAEVVLTRGSCPSAETDLQRRQIAWLDP